MKPIYVPKGAAAEYGDYAVNIYTGCPHGCFYCYAPKVLHRDREEFHTHIEPRQNIVSELRKQLYREGTTGKLVHLCFTCDPYPTGYDSSATREAIKLLKETGNHVQILTKGDGSRDFDLLGDGDWYGVTLDGSETNRRFADVINQFGSLRSRGVKTWVSFEPVLNDKIVIADIATGAAWFDKVKIGKLNYYPSDINWKRFGEKVEQLCKTLHLNYYIKDSLRAEMEKP